VAKLLSKDYVDLKIDTDRMTNGKKVSLRLRGTERGGIPWMVILDSEGKPLVTSDGPGGNIGCPMTPPERAFFAVMLKKTRKILSDNDLKTIQQALAEFAADHE
jgi:hypothetical protein